MRLDIALVDRGDGEAMLEDLVRCRKGAGDVAVPYRELRYDVWNGRVHVQLAVNSGRRAGEYLYRL